MKPPSASALHAVVALSLLFNACAPGEETFRVDPREAELTVRSLMAAIERADTALVEELFWPGATYEDFPNQHVHQGIAEVVGYVTGSHRWADDVVVSVGRVHPTATGAVAEWVFSATQVRPMGDRLPIGTGREVVLNGVTIVELEDGRIIRAADYTDAAAMLLQLGGRIDLPGGGSLELGDVGRPR